jgi:hypothetical protein
MNRNMMFAAATLSLLLAGCQQAQPIRNDQAGNDVAPVAVRDTPAPVATPAIPAPDPAVELTPEAERSETGARDVLLDFARAIERKDFDAAWALLSPADQRKWSKAAFAATFADLGEITVAAPTGTMEGAAGSSYYTAPITITSADKSGRPVRFDGEAVLRRVNVDGATAAQRRWHFESLKLDWTH